MKFTFGDIVVVDKINLGVIVKTWIKQTGPSKREKIIHEVYVRMYNSIQEYPESKLQRYMVRHKYLPDLEIEYQYNALNDL